jgi:3-isopropylmalate dehydrogenase
MMAASSTPQPDVADRIDAAVRTALRNGLRTADIASPGDAVAGTRAMGDAVVAAL